MNYGKELLLIYNIIVKNNFIRCEGDGEVDICLCDVVSDDWLDWIVDGNIFFSFFCLFFYCWFSS